MNLSALRLTWLALALIGGALPVFYALIHYVTVGGSLIAMWWTSPATTGLAWDLLIAGLTLNIWIVAEVSVRRNWEALWAVPATLLIGVGCGLPLYLFLRSKPVL